MKSRRFLLPLILALAGCSSTPEWASSAPPSPAAGSAPLSSAAEADLYLGIVNGLIQQGRYEAAVAFLDQYKTHEAQNPRYQLLRGEALLGARQYAEATAAYNMIVKSNLSAQAYCGLGRIEAAQGHWNAAIGNFQRASALDPANANYLNNLGYAKLHLGNDMDALNSAEGDLKRAYELNPNSNTIRNNLILAAKLSNDHTQLSMLLTMVSDMQRDQVIGFANHWSIDRDSATQFAGGLQ